MGTRMTLVRLAGGELFAHSPIRPDAELRKEVDALGPVHFIASPNKLHHLYLGDFAGAYPEARLLASPGLRAKRRDLGFAADLGDAPDPAWAADLDQAVLRGSFFLEEVVFFHRASRSLIVADMCEHFGPHSPALMRLVARLGRMYDRPRMPPDWQLTFRDRRALRASLERILAWDFDRVILAHGRLIEAGAKEVFREAYRWGLGEAHRG